jgi:hypothetical protein
MIASGLFSLAVDAAVNPAAPAPMTTILLGMKTSRRKQGRRLVKKDSVLALYWVSETSIA